MLNLALFLQDAGGGPLTFLVQFAPIILIFGVFYFLVLMPQKKRQQELRDKIAAVKNGDRIVTNGGILGVITQIKEDTLIIRTADKSTLEIVKSAVASIESPGETK